MYACTYANNARMHKYKQLQKPNESSIMVAHPIWGQTILKLLTKSITEQLKTLGFWEKTKDINLQLVLIKSFSVVALWVPRARDPNATHNAVSMALFPPTRTRIKKKKTSKSENKIQNHPNLKLKEQRKKEKSDSSAGRTPVLACDEINPLSKLDLKAAVAHEILQSDSGNSPSSISSRVLEKFFARNPRIFHLDRDFSFAF